MIQKDWSPYKKRELDIETHAGRRPCENKGRDQGDVSTSQGRPMITSKPPEARGEAWKDSPSQTSEGVSSADTLILDF